MTTITKEALLAKEPKFVDLFSYAGEVLSSFDVSQEEQERYIILYASYSYEHYSGDAVVFGFDVANDTFFQVSGGHCSCYGLEGQFDPEPLTVEEIAEFYSRGAPHFVDWIDG